MVNVKPTPTPAVKTNIERGEIAVVLLCLHSFGSTGLIGHLKMCFDKVWRELLCPRGTKGTRHTNTDPTRTPEHREPNTCVGSSSLHLPVLGVKTVWNRGGHSDRLLWGSLVNSYSTPPLLSFLALSSPPTHYTPQRAGLNGLVYPLSLTGTNVWTPPSHFPYQPPIGIPPWSAVSAPTPTVRPNFHLNMERSLDFDTSQTTVLLHFLVLRSAESCSHGIDKNTHLFPNMNFDTPIITWSLIHPCCLPIWRMPFEMCSLMVL